MQYHPAVSVMTGFLMVVVFIITTTSLLRIQLGLVLVDTRTTKAADLTAHARFTGP